MDALNSSNDLTPEQTEELNLCNTLVTKLDELLDQTPVPLESQQTYMAIWLDFMRLLYIISRRDPIALFKISEMIQNFHLGYREYEKHSPELNIRGFSDN